MCGIFAILRAGSDSISFSKYNDIISNAFYKGESRGPEHSVLKYINNNILFGFHRLAINGINEVSNQPISIKGVHLICNGEIYNYKNIYRYLNVKPRTNSDCEAIIHLYLKYGIDYTLENLDGVFSFVLYDSNTHTIHVARDPFGVRPLYYGIVDGYYVFASLLKQIVPLADKCYNFEAGTYSSFQINRKSKLIMNTNTNKYPAFNYTHSLYNNNIISHSETKYYHEMIYNTLLESVKKRVITMERNLACLLSGGLDSSLITAMVAKFIPKGQLQTYSIGMPGGSDLKYAKSVAHHIHSNHTEIVVSQEEFIQAIPEVIYKIESYDTTTIRASVGNYLVAKYIAEHSDAKVIFNGDGSDELTGGYLYFHDCPSDIEFDHECKRLLSDIQYFDVLRSDRCISCHGLEPRTPFLDRTFVHKYLSIPSNIRNHNNQNAIEKNLLRCAVESIDPLLLPTDILWRKKEAFSDGVSAVEKSWHEIIQDKLVDKYSDEEFHDKSQSYTTNPPTTREQLYYREIFESHYPDKGEIIPYFWMPRYNDANDASARTLAVYNKFR